MRNLRKMLLPALLFSALTLKAQLPAFPEAEGFGKYATGGRNGTVYHVTNLNDGGSGSFRDAVSQPDRIVVFDIGGIIHIDTRIVIHRNITVAGQTAPGEGITIYGNGIALNDDSGNSIIRYIRIRMGQYGDYGKDAISLSAGTDYMFDHVSISWGRDGTFDINGSGIDNVSIQDCIISQGINKDNHSTGGLMQSGKFSIIRTLWIDNKTRNPKGRGTHDFINSVIYNWKEDGFIMGDTEGESYVNLIGNYFIAGPSSTVDNYITRTTPTFYLYPEDNRLDGNKDGALNGTELLASSGGYKTATIMETPFSHPGVNNLLSAEEAVNHIVAVCGASLARDTVDKLLIHQLKSFGTLGQIIDTEDDNGIEGAVGTVRNGPKPPDADGDGMPDEWEDANGTDKNLDDAMTINGNGYANIENYFNSIAAALPFLKSPVNIVVSAVDTSHVSLEWMNEEEDAGGLAIEYGTSPADFTHSDTVAGNANSATVGGLLSGTLYYFRIRAFNDSLESAWSEVISAETTATPVPPLPCVSPSPEDGSTIGFLNNVLLTWDNTTTPMGGTLYFDVYFGTSEDAMDLVASHQTGKYHLAGSLEASTTYYWRVKAINDLGADDGSAWSFTTGSSTREMVLYIPFDDTTGTAAENLAGPNDAEASNMIPVWEPGIRANCLYFSASPANASMVVEYYDDLAMGTSPFTISLWFRSTGGGIEDTYLLHKGTHSADYGTLGTGKWFGIQYRAGERLTFAIDDNSTKTALDVTDPGRYFDGEWHHLVCMRDIAAGKIRMFMDGTMLKEVTDNTGNISETAEFVIGNCNYNFNTPFRGNMDELEIYNDALSDAEVAYLYSTERVSVSVSVPGTAYADHALDVYPNPFRERITLMVPAGDSPSFRVKIIDLNGKVVWTGIVKDASSRISIGGLEKLPGGFYTCILFDNSRLYVCKLLKY